MRECKDRNSHYQSMDSSIRHPDDISDRATITLTSLLKKVFLCVLRDAQQCAASKELLNEYP